MEKGEESDIACCACSRCGTFPHWQLFFGHKYREQTIQHLLQAIHVPFSPFTNLLQNNNNNKNSPVPGAGHSLLPFPIHTHPLDRDESAVTLDH